MTRTGFSAINEANKRSAPSTPTKIYELYPVGLGFSVQTIDYHGTKLMVAATSIRQAYAMAHKKIWIDPSHRYPVGIVSVLRVKHGAGIRALREAIAEHHYDNPL